MYVEALPSLRDFTGLSNLVQVCGADDASICYLSPMTNVTMMGSLLHYQWMFFGPNEFLRDQSARICGYTEPWKVPCAPARRPTRPMNR